MDIRVYWQTYLLQCDLVLQPDVLFLHPAGSADGVTEAGAAFNFLESLVENLIDECGSRSPYGAEHFKVGMHVLYHIDICVVDHDEIMPIYGGIRLRYSPQPS